MDGIPEITIVSMAKGWGGAEEYLELFARELASRGIGYHIIVRSGGEYAKRHDGRADIVATPHSLSGLLRLAKIDPPLIRNRVIHVNRYYDIFRGWFLKRKIPGSILILYQHCYLNHPNRLPLSLTEGILCISEFVKSSLTKKYPSFEKKIQVINTAINTDVFHAKKNRYETSGPVKIGMAGRFDKNQEELLEIGGELKKRGIEIALHLAGEGAKDEEKGLRALAKETGLDDDVVFHGNIPHAAMPSFYADMDIMASTMRMEGLSLVAMEAMACGLPFVAYNVSGFRELIDDGENGILVGGGREEFRKAIEGLIRSSEMRKRLGLKAAQKANEDFGIERHVDRYLVFIEELLRRKGGIS